MVETISVTRGLREVWLLKERIEKTIISTRFAATVMGSNLIDGLSQEDYANQVAAYANTIDTLIRRRDAIKRAIVLSNATTRVYIGGIEMTVAEAIERKASIEHEKSLLAKLVQDFRLASNLYERLVAEAQDRRDQQLNALLQSGVRAADEEYRATAAAFDLVNTPKIVDPLNISQRIDRLAQRIQDFESEVDISLSESNGHTMITAEY